MTFNEKIELIAIPVVKNEFGDEIDGVETVTKVLAHVKSVTKNEFYKYGNEDHHLEYIVTICKWDYNEENTVRIRGIKYHVFRRYYVDRDYIELTLTRRSDKYEK